MCFFSTPSPPKMPPLPTPPSVTMEEVRQREAAERARMAMAGGTAATVKTDLAPQSVAAEQQPQRKVLLGV